MSQHNTAGGLLAVLLALSTSLAAAAPPTRTYDIPADLPVVYQALELWQQQSGFGVVDWEQTTVPDTWVSERVAGTLEPFVALRLMLRAHCVDIRHWRRWYWWKVEHVWSVRMRAGCEARVTHLGDWGTVWRCEAVLPQYIGQCDEEPSP